MPPERKKKFFFLNIPIDRPTLLERSVRHKTVFFFGGGLIHTTEDINRRKQLVVSINIDVLHR